MGVFWSLKTLEDYYMSLNNICDSDDFSHIDVYIYIMKMLTHPDLSKFQPKFSAIPNYDCKVVSTRKIVDLPAGRKMRLGNIELCSRGDSIPAFTSKIEVMHIKIDSEKMVAPSNKDLKIISSQGLKFGPAIRMGVNVTLKSSVFEDLLSFVCKTFRTYVAPSTYLKSCLLIPLRIPLAFKGGG
jgi:hypothetical protein